MLLAEIFCYDVNDIVNSNNPNTQIQTEMRTMKLCR